MTRPTTSKKIKKISLTIGVIVLILVALVFIINFTFGFILPIIDVPMYVGTDIDWLNFIGIFLGSGLTLFGVHWQLKNNREENYVKLISNTTATYGLLEMESTTLKLSVANCIGQFDTIEKEILKRSNYKETEIKEVINAILELKKDDLLTEKNVIFSFINDSLPKEKIILVDSTSKLMICSNDFKYMKQYNKNINDFEIMKPLYETVLKNIDDYIEELESRKTKFEKLYSS